MYTSNNHKNPPFCTYSETLVAVLYGEATPQEAEDFEHHLKQCHECGDELAAFGILRGAISDWRETSFANLDSPEIAVSHQNQVIESEISSNNLWLESLRRLFSPASFGWQATAAGFAAFVILGFLLLATSDLFNPVVERADAPRPVVVNTPEIKPIPQEQTMRAAAPVSPNDQEDINVYKAEEKNRSVSSRMNGKASKEFSVPASPNRVSPKPKTPIQKTDQKAEDLSLLPAEAEDDSLRLTDLLEEIEPSV